MGMIRTPNQIKKMYEVGKIPAEKKPVQNGDVLFFHNALVCRTAEELDKPSLLMNHSCLRELTFLYEYFIEMEDPVSKKLIEENREEILEGYKELIHMPDVVISNSEFIQEMCEKYFDRESTVVYPPVDRDFFRPVNKKPESVSGDYYFSAQRMDWGKRVDVQIEAFGELDEEIVIAGPGYMAEEISYLASKHDNVHYIGEVKGEELVRLYSNAKGVIQSAHKEDFGTVTREAMACGTPVIVPNEGGQAAATHGGECGIKFDLGERAEGLRKAVKRFDPGEYEEEVLRKESERYDLEKNIAPQLKRQVKKAIYRHENR